MTRVVVAIVTVASLALATPLVASAQDGGPGINSTVKQYKLAPKTYAIKLAAIEQTFVDAILNAISLQNAGLKAAQSVAQKIVVQNEFIEQKVTAIADRQAALIALGPPPVSIFPDQPIPTVTDVLSALASVI